MDAKPCWHAFKDKRPPAHYDVLVTNSIHEWMGFDDGGRRIRHLTHWCAIPQPQEKGKSR